jgi:hypothetical protein
MKTCLVIPFVLLAISKINAQKISYLKALPTGDFVTVYYQLESPLDGQVFNVELYSSHDDYQKPLQNVRGDQGAGIVAGKLKKIEWGVRQELGRFRGDLAFEVRAHLIFSPITILFPYATVSLQRGQAYSFTWKGGLESDSLQFNLIAEGRHPVPVGSTTNTGKYDWVLPDKLPERNDYQLEAIWWNRGKRYQALSGKFSVKKKVS